MIQVHQLQNNTPAVESINARGWGNVIRSRYAYSGFDRVVNADTIVDVLVGEVMTLTAAVTGGDVSWKMIRTPPAPGPRQAACKFTNGQLIASTPGRYDIQVSISGWSRLITIAALPTEVNRSLEYPQDADARRRRLRAILKAASPASVEAALEGQKWDPTALAVLVGRPRGTPLSLKAYS